MKQFDIMQAYNTLGILADNKNYHEKEQWLIYRLRRELRPNFEFQKQREEILNNEYIPFADEHGVLHGEKYIEYMNKIQEINDIDAEPKFEKIKLPFVDGVTFKIAEPLENFIEFELNE